MFFARRNKKKWTTTSRGRKTRRPVLFRGSGATPLPPRKQGGSTSSIPSPFLGSESESQVFPDAWEEYTSSDQGQRHPETAGDHI